MNHLVFMQMEEHKKFENKIVTEYRTNVRRTKWWINHLFTPFWLQAPTTSSLILSFVVWLAGIVLAFHAKSTHHNETVNKFTSIDILLVLSTISMAGICISYYKKKDSRGDSCT
jgi:fumarate reductase subunit C